MPEKSLQTRNKPESKFINLKKKITKHTCPLYYFRTTMPRAKNTGPCVITGCEGTNRFYRMTAYTIEKIRNKDLENKYNFIKEGDQLCSKHYPDIVEPDRNTKYREKKNSSETDNLHSGSSSSQLINMFTDESNIKINYTNENVTMSRDDFSLLVKNIEQMKLQLDNQLYQVEEKEDPSFDDEVDNGNLSHKENGHAYYMYIPHNCM